MRFIVKARDRFASGLRFATLVLGVLALSAPPSVAQAQPQPQPQPQPPATSVGGQLIIAPEYAPAVARGLSFLRARAGQAGAGETALVAMSLAKSGANLADPALANCLTVMNRRFNGTLYQPERTAGSDVYEAGVLVMAYTAIDPVANKAKIEALANHLISKQKSNGSWDYDHRTAGDTSISQYAVLGLWEAENAGISVSPSIWDRAAEWYASAQGQGGSWNYHRDESSTHPETLSMTAAGVGSLLICRMQLQKYRKGGIANISPYLTPTAATAEKLSKRYEPRISIARINGAVNRGMDWITRYYASTDQRLVGRAMLYYLYGVERVVALSEAESRAAQSWYVQGAQYILATQRSDGAWFSEFGEDATTSWGVLFLVRSTAQSVAKVRKGLGAGTLLGGRGLPKDLSSLTVAGGRVVARPMNGAVEGMLAVLEDPRAINADSAFAGLVTRYEADGPLALVPYVDRFRQLLARDPDPGIRAVAAWALGRSGSFEVVPALLDALKDKDEEVVREAAVSLRVLSRRLDPLAADLATAPELRDSAAARWRQWYESLSPEEKRFGPLAGSALVKPPEGRGP